MIYWDGMNIISTIVAVVIVIVLYAINKYGKK